MRRFTKTNLLGSLLAATALEIAVGGCGTLAGNPEDDDGKGGGATKPPAAAVAFNITDAPIAEAKHVYVTIAHVEVLASDGTWIDIPLALETEVDLLTLTGGTAAPLATLADLPVGTYEETRLVLSEDQPSRLVDRDDVEHVLKVPSGSETGLQIKSPFDVVEGETTTLTIDFDLRKSIKHADGNDAHDGKDGGGHNKATSKSDKYILKPVLRLLNDADIGLVSGTAPEGAIVCVFDERTAPDATDDCDKSENSAVVKDGKYQIGFVPKGKHRIRIYQEDGTTKDVDDFDVESGKHHDVDHNKDKDIEDKDHDGHKDSEADEQHGEDDSGSDGDKGDLHGAEDSGGDGEDESDTGGED